MVTFRNKVYSCLCRSLLRLPIHFRERLKTYTYDVFSHSQWLKWEKIVGGYVGNEKSLAYYTVIFLFTLYFNRRYPFFFHIQITFLKETECLRLTLFTQYILLSISQKDSLTWWKYIILINIIP